MNSKKLFFFLLVSGIVCLPIFYHAEIFRRNDLEANIVNTLHIKNSLIHQHRFPLVNPYINLGIPLLLDPLSNFLNPVSFIPLFILSPELAVKTIYYLSLVMTCIAGYFLFRIIGSSPNQSSLQSATFAVSSYYMSRILAGHLEKVLSYPWIVMFVLLIIRFILRPSLLTLIGLGVAHSLMIYSGDVYSWMYGWWFLLVALLATRKIVLVLPSLILSAPKYIPILLTLTSLDKKIEPFIGSQAPINLVQNLFVPSVDFTVKSNLFVNSWGWWESSSYIGPLFLLGFILFLVKIKSYINFKVTRIVLFCLGLSVLLASPAIRINPYNWAISLIPGLNLFHVPSRIFPYMTLFIMILSSIAFRKKKLYSFLLIINLLSVISFSNYLYGYKQFLPLSLDYPKALEILSKINKSGEPVMYDVVNFPLQLIRAQELGLKMVVSTHPLYLKNTPTSQWMNYLVYRNVTPSYFPRYLIWPDSEPTPPFLHLTSLAKVGHLNILEVFNYDSYKSLHGR